MDKPASVRRVELKKEIVTLLNEAKLPPYVLEPILVDILDEIRSAIEMQYKSELAQWEEGAKQWTQRSSAD